MQKYENYKSTVQKKLGSLYEQIGDIVTAENTYICDNHTTMTCQETMRSLRRFLPLEEDPEFSYTENSLEFFVACETLD